MPGNPIIATRSISNSYCPKMNNGMVADRRFFPENKRFVAMACLLLGKG
jgi:hypothetical protein